MIEPSDTCRCDKTPERSFNSFRVCICLYQDLPKATVPDVRTTLSRYLASLQPVLPVAQYEQTAISVQCFLDSGDADQLQRDLCQFADQRDNWVSVLRRRTIGIMSESSSMIIYLPARAQVDSSPARSKRIAQRDLVVISKAESFALCQLITQRNSLASRARFCDLNNLQTSDAQLQLCNFLSKQTARVARRTQLINNSIARACECLHNITVAH